MVSTCRVALGPERLTCAVVGTRVARAVPSREDGVILSVENIPRSSR